MTEIIKAETAMTGAIQPLERVADMVLNTVDERSQRDYRRALLGHTGPRSKGKGTLGFLPWLAVQRTGLNRMTVNAYIAYLKAEGVTDSSINQRMAAIRKLAKEAANNGLLDDATASGIGRIDNIKIQGKKLGNWLTKSQAEQMLNAPAENTAKGIRDRAILAIMIGAGLRREEVVTLTLEHFQQREGRWVILDLKGKHNRTRTVPIAPWIKARVDQWVAYAGIASGTLFLRIRRGGHLQETGMTSQAIWDVVQEYSPIDNLAPHDLRRSFAKIADKSGAPMAQIQKSLGHESIQTTERYIGSDLDLQNAPSDYIKFNLGG